MSAAYKANSMVAVRKVIRKSIPDDIRENIPEFLLTKNPEQVCATLQQVMADDSEAVHRRLEAEHRVLQLRPGSTTSEYIIQNKSMRRPIIHAQYGKSPYNVHLYDFLSMTLKVIMSIRMLPARYG